MGRIFFDGRDITYTRPDRILARGMARTFQNIRLFATMSALENVLVGQHARMRAGLFRSILRTPGVRREEREAEEKGRELLDYVGLQPDVVDQMAVEPVVWRPAPRGDRPGAGLGSRSFSCSTSPRPG